MQQKQIMLTTSTRNSTNVHTSGTINDDLEKLGTKIIRKLLSKNIKGTE